MSTFSGLNTAFTGLTAARHGLDVVGHNIANANTVGYTRQRLTTTAIGPTANVGPLGGGLRPGQGVSVDAISRLGNVYFDARVRSSAASAGYQVVRANTMLSLEATFREPGENGLSAQLDEFWASWQDLSNRAGETAPAAVLLEHAKTLAGRVASGYGAVESQWREVHSQAESMAAELNSVGQQVADLNKSIRQTQASGGSINDLLDQRNLLTTTIASIAGGTVRDLGDGTVEVLIGGNALVNGDTFRAVKVTGSRDLQGLQTPLAATVRLEWADRPGAVVALDGGEIAGALSMLAPADATGTGGALAQAAESYNNFARELAAQVNAIYNPGPVPGSDFFEFTDPRAAATLSVVAGTTAESIALGASKAGKDGAVAAAIAQLGVAPTGPNTVWAAFVTTIGVATRAEMQRATLADMAATSAVNTQLANSTVDLDEENVSLLMYQHAYQGAARVMTAVDEMLDTLINRTGLVGR